LTGLKVALVYPLSSSLATIIWVQLLVNTVGFCGGLVVLLRVTSSNPDTG
jgi:hypothetical protein